MKIGVLEYTVVVYILREFAVDTYHDVIQLEIVMYIPCLVDLLELAHQSQAHVCHRRLVQLKVPQELVQAHLVPRHYHEVHRIILVLELPTLDDARQ